MEDHDEKALALWQHFRDLSIAKYKETYARLNIQFDVYSGESQVEDAMLHALDKLKELNLLEQDKGAELMDLTKDKLGKALIRKTDGTTLYLTRDIGTAVERHKLYQFDKMYYVVASQQDLHLKQLFNILGRMGYDWAPRCQHISFGMVTGMSTRKGTAVFLDQILEETRDLMHEVMKKNEVKYAQVEEPEKVADIIGISAVMIQDMQARRIKNYDFDWKRMLSFEGDTGPYLQYAHSRLCSIERSYGKPIDPDADIALLTETEADELISVVAMWPDVLQTALHTLEPCTVVTYAFKLSHAVSSAFEALWVMGATPQVAAARMLMYWSARMALGNAMRVLGLRPLERM